MTIKIGKWEIRITKFWYGHYREMKIIHAFSVGFIHLLRNNRIEKGGIK